MSDPVNRIVDATEQLDKSERGRAARKELLSFMDYYIGLDLQNKAAIMDFLKAVGEDYAGSVLDALRNF